MQRSQHTIQFIVQQANLTDISITVLGTGLLLEDNQRLVQVQEAVPSVLKVFPLVMAYILMVP